MSKTILIVINLKTLEKKKLVFFRNDFQSIISKKLKGTAIKIEKTKVFILLAYSLEAMDPTCN